MLFITRFAGSFLCPPVRVDLFLFAQALETLDNGKPYVISYLVDLDMVLRCLRYGLRLPVLCFGRATGEGVLLEGWKQNSVKGSQEWEKLF